MAVRSDILKALEEAKKIFINFNCLLSNPFHFISFLKNKITEIAAKPIDRNHLGCIGSAVLGVTSLIPASVKLAVSIKIPLTFHHQEYEYEYV